MLPAGAKRQLLQIRTLLRDEGAQQAVAWSAPACSVIREFSAIRFGNSRSQSVAVSVPTPPSLP